MLLLLLALHHTSIVLAKLSVPDGYDKTESPPGLDVVRIGFEVFDISEIDEKDFSIKVKARN